MTACEVFVFSSFLLAGCLVYFLYTFLFLVIYAFLFIKKKKFDLTHYINLGSIGVLRFVDVNL